jgi:hypothetical protein
MTNLDQNEKDIKQAKNILAGLGFGFGGFMALSIGVSLTLTGVVIWAIIQLVQHFAH